MTDERIRELLEALYELFWYGFPVYPNSPVSDGRETFQERVEELLEEMKKEK